MLRFGVHMFLRPSLPDSVRESAGLGCNAIQIFSKSPRTWYTASLEGRGLDEFRTERERLGLEPLAVHASYLINLASSSAFLRGRSVKALAEELKRAEEFGAEYLVVHIGSSQEEDRVGLLRRVADGVSKALKASKTKSVRLLLENMAGERGDVGSSFKEIARILELVGRPDRTGVCLDTCHAFQAGIDLRSPEAVERAWRAARRALGPDALKLVHLNDSKKPLGGRADRHEHIGKGHIGEAGFKAFLRHPGFSKLPLILETPKDSPTADSENLAKVRALAGLDS